MGTWFVLVLVLYSSCFLIFRPTLSLLHDSPLVIWSAFFSPPYCHRTPLQPPRLLSISISHLTQVLLFKYAVGQMGAASNETNRKNSFVLIYKGFFLFFGVINLDPRFRELSRPHQRARGSRHSVNTSQTHALGRIVMLLMEPLSGSFYIYFLGRQLTHIQGNLKWVGA